MPCGRINSNSFSIPRYGEYTEITTPSIYPFKKRFKNVNVPKVKLPAINNTITFEFFIIMCEKDKSVMGIKIVSIYLLLDAWKLVILVIFVPRMRLVANIEKAKNINFLHICFYEPLCIRIMLKLLTY